MKRHFTLLAFALVMLTFPMKAQRYFSEVFSDVNVTNNVVYGANFTVLSISVTGHTMLQPLAMDVYQPAGDVQTERPLILYFHTGNFLPTPQNGSTSGTKSDSSVVELCTRFAKMGYVVASCDYRLGWNPIASTQPERVYGLINAAYRGVQDCRTAVRYFRKTVAESANPYGIDPDKICVWGQGTGGYIAFAASTLNDWVTDIAALPKFNIDVNGTPTPMVIPQINGDMDGTTLGINPVASFAPAGDTLCVPNHIGYSSAFNVMVNMGGACGDSSWVEDGSIPMISFHVPTDPFAPFNTGTVYVPLPPPNDPLAVVEVSGSGVVQTMADTFGNNDIFDLMGAPNNDVWSQAANMHNNGHNGLFPLVRPNLPQYAYDSSPWDFWSTDNVNSANGFLTNPDMTPLKARTYCDTIQGYAAPRIACALQLPGSACTIDVEEVKEGFNFSIAPNPTEGTFSVVAPSVMTSIEIFNTLGQKVEVISGINTRRMSIDRDLTSGVYLISIISEGKRSTQRLVVR